MNKKQFLRLISPGIRLKLSFFTILLIFAIVSVTSIINYNQQKAALSEKIESETKVPVEFVNSIVVDIENINRSLVLVEEFKIRVREKKKELTKFKKVVVRQESGFFGALKDLGKSIGLDLKKKNIYSSQDTYFSRYLTEKEITDFEGKVRSQLKKGSGAPIEEKVYLRIRSLAEKAAIEILNQEKSDIRLNEIVAEVNELQKAKQNEQLSNEEKNQIPPRLNFLDTEQKKINKQILVSKSRSQNFQNLLTKSLQNFFRDSFQDQITSLGLSPEKIRILSFDQSGKETMDTGLLLSHSGNTGKKLLALPEFIESKKNFFKENKTKTQVKNSNLNVYEVGGRQYDVSYRPVFKNPNSAARAIKIYESISQSDSRYLKVLDEDKKFVEKIKDLAIKLKSRLAELRKNLKIKPGDDKEYKSLAKEYETLIEKREKIFLELSLAKPAYETYLEKWKQELESQKQKLKDTEAEIVSLDKSRNRKLEENEKPIDPEEIQVKIQNLESIAEEIRDLISNLEASKEDISRLEEQMLADSFFYLRESALQDFVFVPYRSSPSQLDRYYKDINIRKNEIQKFKMLRSWILSGNSETELPKYRGSSLFSETGILIRSRSEAEEMMWLLDSTPILQSIEESKGLLFDILEKDLLGYNILIIDRTEGLRQIRKNRDIIIRYVGIICLVAVVLAYIFAWLFVRKLKVISKQAEEIEKGNLNVFFPSAGYDEVGILSDSLNDMVVGLREREEMRGELVAAEEIQKRLLPEKLPTSLEDKIEIAAFYKAMTGVGGDYYDFIELSDGKLAFCIGDVSNHGVGPAIIMALFRSQLRSILRRGERNLKKILLELNTNLYEETPDHIFITFFIGIFDSKTSQVEYVSAGHIKPLFYDASKNKVHELPAGGLPLGMDENSFFETTIERKGIVLEEGDIFFQHTDGLDEARSKGREFFGRDRITSILLSNGTKSATEIITAVVSEAEKHTGEVLTKSGVSNLTDDMAMIALRRRPNGTQTNQS